MRETSLLHILRMIIYLILFLIILFHSDFLFLDSPKVQLSPAMLHIQNLTISGWSADDEKTVQYDYQTESKPVTWTEENVQDNYNFMSELAR